jgi:transcriptional regulator with PAS, ATPase and Fis domain
MIFADGGELTLANFRDLDDMPGEAVNATVPEASSATTIRETVGNMEYALIREALDRHKGNKKKVAAELGISRSYLYKKLGEMSSRP